MPEEPGPLPEPTPDEDKKAQEEVEDWLKKQGYPTPNPEDQ
jgi:hypothetical protein